MKTIRSEQEKAKVQTLLCPGHILAFKEQAGMLDRKRNANEEVKGVTFTVIIHY